jgi:type II secretory pathway component GspD/PulD (secretin)
MMPQYGQLNAYAPANILIISDHASNVNRIMRIIGRIDQVGDAGCRSRADAERLGHRGGA